MMRSQSYVHLGDEKMAVADLSAALKLGPNDRAMFNRANAYLRMDDTEGAAADYRSIIETATNPQVKYDAQKTLDALTP